MKRVLFCATVFIFTFCGELRFVNPSLPRVATSLGLLALSMLCVAISMRMRDVPQEKPDQ